MSLGTLGEGGGMVRMVKDADGRMWEVSEAFRSGGGSAAPGQNIMHLLDRITLIFRYGSAQRFYSEDVSEDWGAVSDEQLVAWLEAAAAER